MKNLKKSLLIAALLMAATFSACKKGKDVTPGDDQSKFTNSAQLFLDDNSSIIQEGDAVTGTYTDNTLKITFSQGGADVSVQIPNYDLNASQNDYNNSSAIVGVAKGGKSYLSTNIFIPVILFNPTRPVFVTDKNITLTATNTTVNANTTDVALQIHSGSELITTPVSNGSAPVYDRVGFVLGTGGKPNIITVRINK